MQETVLQSIGSRLYNGHDFCEKNVNTQPGKLSAIDQPKLQTPHKKCEQVTQVHNTPVLTGSRTVNHTMAESPNPYPGYIPYSHVNRFIPSYRQPLLPSYSEKRVLHDANKSTSSDDEIDVVNDSGECSLRTTDLPNNTDSSISTQGSASTSPSSSTTSLPSPPASEGSPGSTSSTNHSPSLSEGPIKKKARTNYSPSQVQALERVFNENPYPDPDMMESLSTELGIPENKLKIWFQNKRARWRRRMNDNVNRYQNFMPMSPVLSPVSPFGLMAHNPLMTSSPPHMLPGFMPMPYPGSPSLSGNQPPSRITAFNGPASVSRAPTTPTPPMFGHTQITPTQAPFQHKPNMMASPQTTVTSSASMSGPQFAPLLYPYSYPSFPGVH